MKSTGLIFLIILIVFLSSCQMTDQGVVLTRPSPQPTKIPTFTFEVKQQEILFTPTSSPGPTVTEKPQVNLVCPPLEGYSSSDLETAVVNPYLPPPPGFDRPHHGVDLGVREGTTGIAIAGDSVRAILSGEIKMVVTDRFPYGNAVLVETKLGNVEDLVDILEPVLPEWGEVTADPALTCPEYKELELSQDEHSIYILYAHLDEPPATPKGTMIECGEALGNIGMSGNALNPHVHVEARMGPSGADFESMAHYDSSATESEMGAYCSWRVNGIFQHFDPMFLLQYIHAYP